MEGITRVRYSEDGDGITITRAFGGMFFSGNLSYTQLSKILQTDWSEYNGDTQQYLMWVKVFRDLSNKSFSPRPHLYEFNMMWQSDKTELNGIVTRTYVEDTFFLSETVLRNFRSHVYPSGTIICPQRGGGEDA